MTTPLIDITKSGDTRMERIKAFNAFVQQTEGVFVHNLLNYVDGKISLTDDAITVTLRLPRADFVGDRGMLGFPMEGKYLPVLTFLDMAGVKD